MIQRIQQRNVHKMYLKINSRKNDVLSSTYLEKDRNQMVIDSILTRTNMANSNAVRLFRRIEVLLTTSKYWSYDYLNHEGLDYLSEITISNKLSFLYICSKIKSKTFKINILT